MCRVPCMFGDVFGSGSVIVSTSELSSVVSHVSLLLQVCAGPWLGRVIAVAFDALGTSATK